MDIQGVRRKYRRKARIYDGGMWGPLLNPLTLAYSRTAITNLAGFDRPWTILERTIGRLEVESCLSGTAYLAHGVKPG
jgi:hypothetical protein